MTDYAALKEALLKIGSGATDDVALAAAINSATATAKKDISTREAIARLVFTGNGDWGTIVAAADGSLGKAVPAEDRVKCVAFKELFTRVETVMTTDEEVWTRLTALVDALVAAKCMSSEGKSALVALARPVVPLAVALGWESEIGDGDIAAVKKWIVGTATAMSDEAVAAGKLSDG